MLQHIRRPDLGDYLRWELRHRFVIKTSVYRNGISDREDPRIDDADNIARVGYIHRAAVLSDQTIGPREAHLLSCPVVSYNHVALKSTRTHPQESHAVPMFRIHVRLNLKNIRGEGCRGGIDLQRVTPGVDGLVGMGPGSHLSKGIKERLDPEVGQRRSKEDRGNFAGKEILVSKCVSGGFQELQLVLKVLGLPIVQLTSRFGLVKAHRPKFRLAGSADSGLSKENAPSRRWIYDPLKGRATSDRPTYRRRKDP